VKEPTVTTPYLAELLAEFRGAELRREACTARLAALAACCRPSSWARTARRAVDALTRLRTTVGRDRAAAACCAAA
jgi:hypothetical protein